MTKLEIQTIVTAVLNAIENSNKQPVKAVKPVKTKVQAEGLTEGQLAYRKSVGALLRKKFGKDVDIQWNVNVLTYDKWSAKGRKVKTGEKACKGLFHLSQTEVAA